VNWRRDSAPIGELSHCFITYQLGHRMTPNYKLPHVEEREGCLATVETLLARYD
jgi:hypothetical protein